MIIEEKPDLNSSSAPISKITELSEEEQKEQINKNYLPNLSNYQKISIKLKDEKEKDKFFILYPDSNYTDDSKKGFYIFYNNNLTLLKELYEFELKKLVKNHTIVLYHIKDYLKKLDIKYDEESYYHPFRIASWLISLNYQPIVDKARSLADNLIKIKNIEKLYGTDIKNYICEIIINDDPEEIFKNIKYEEKSQENESIYLNAENRFGQLENDYKDNLTYVIELEKLLDEYLGIIGQNPSTSEKKNFLCFILNRASFYLSNAAEQLRENLDLELLKKLDKLRRKINNLLLKYRYKFEENKKSILEIEIEKFKSLKDAIDVKSIYLEKTDVQKYIIQLEDALQNKASNLKAEKNFETLSLKEIQEIASLRDVNINSNENIKEAMENKISELNAKKDSNNSEIAIISAEIGSDAVGKIVSQLTGIPQINNNKKEDKTTDNKKEDKTTDNKKEVGTKRISQLIAENKQIEKDIQNYKNKIERLNVNQNYDIDFINILKLYILLIRKNYHTRNDYSGLIITETKKIYLNKKSKNIGYENVEETSLREYEIKEISK